jgi:hypothetical protein
VVVCRVHPFAWTEAGAWWEVGVPSALTGRTAYDQHKAAVETGAWFLWRFDPRRAATGENPWQIDMREPSRPLSDYAYHENRFNALRKEHPKTAAIIMARAQNRVRTRWGIMKHRASLTYDSCPFETGAIGEEALAAEGASGAAKEVVGIKSGLNCPVDCDVEVVPKVPREKPPAPEPPAANDSEAGE